MDSWITVGALLFGAALFVLLEVLTPTFGVMAALALGCLVTGVVFAFGISSQGGMFTLLGSLIVTPLYCAMLIKLLPKSPLGKKVFLGKAKEGTGDAMPEAAALAGLVGKIGIAESPLHRSGAIRIDGKRYFAMAENDPIENGATVQVVKFDGMDIVVRQCEEKGHIGT